MQWANFITASMAIVLANNNDTPMGGKLRSKIYVNDRCPGKVKFKNSVRKSKT